MVRSQGGAPGNAFPGTFLGWNATSGNNALEIRTSNLNRFLIRQNGFGAFMQNYPGAPLTNPLPGFRQTRIGISRDGLNPVLFPQSLLHLGYDSPFFTTGRRSWQEIGTMYSAETDNFYVGLRQKLSTDLTGRTSTVLANPNDAQDAVITWGDNYIGNGPAPDNNLAFIFHAPTNNLNPYVGTDYGREVMRMNGTGNVGIGPVFFDNAQPQSMLHVNNDLNNPAFLQISNSGSTGQTATDGTKLGIEGATGNAFLYNQENRPLMFSSNNIPTGYGAGHRMLITNVGSFTQPPGFIGNIPGAPLNRTRVSISHDPANPLIKPLSLLHLGFNTRYGFNFASTVGWRPWMDVGMMVSSSSAISEHVYLGMKPEANRNDVVLAWGANDVAQFPVLSPTRFRLIFSSNPGAGLGTSSGANGTEFLRCVTSTLASTADPRIGIGNFEAFGLDAGNTIEINTQLGVAGNLGAGLTNPAIPGSWPGSTGASGLRFRDLTSLSAVVPTSVYATATINPTHVLSVDGNGDVVKIVPTASVQTNNGISTTSLGVVQLGIDCPSPSPSITTAFQLLNDRQVPMNNFNFIFSNALPIPSPFGLGSRVGIGTNCRPGNRLEVDRNTGTSPVSGLRLTQLAGAVPTTSTNTVLSVDASGDVILTTVTVTPGAGGVGNLCAAPQNPLTGDYEVPLGTFKYHFTGQSVITPSPGPQENIVTVGYPCGATTPVAKFSVLEQQTVVPVSFRNYAGHFSNFNPATTSTTGLVSGGIFGESKGANPPNAFEPINAGGVFEGQFGFFNIGALGRNAGLSTPFNVNGTVIATGGYNIGGAFLSDTDVVTLGSPLFNYGVYARGANATAGNYGIYAEAIPNPAWPNQSNYGIFAQCLPTTGTVIPGPGNWAGYFSGDVVRTGNDNFSSDQNLKQSINTLTNGLSLINQLSPKTFSYQTNTYPQMGLPSGLQYGLIAQQVQTVIPQLVNSATHPSMTLNNTNYPAVNYLTLEYQQLIPILIKAVQELSAQNQAQDSLIQVLTQNINACCENQQAKQTGINGNGKNAQQQVLNQMNIDLSDKDVIVLNQNIPNPYAEHTTITYNVPVQFKYAQMIFKTIDGRIIKTTDLEKGKGQLNVFASDLSNGLYMYTLIVDGKEFDTKKMVKQN